MVFYYSLGGATKAYAEVLSELLNEQAIELRETSPRAGFLGVARGAIEAIFKIPVALEPLPELPQGKPLFICSPIWGGNLAPAAETFLKNADLRRRKVNVILTCASITRREDYKKKITNQLRSKECGKGFVQVFVTDRKSEPDRAVVRKHLKKLVLNVDESF